MCVKLEYVEVMKYDIFEFKELWIRYNILEYEEDKMVVLIMEIESLCYFNWNLEFEKNEVIYVLVKFVSLLKEKEKVL